MSASLETVYKLLCELPRSEREALLEYLAWREANFAKSETIDDWEDFSELDVVPEDEDDSSAVGKVEFTR